VGSAVEKDDFFNGFFRSGEGGRFVGGGGHVKLGD